jgi:sugar-specific transcriptional regulator TrmB
MATYITIMKYTNILTELGLATNEAKIYETLLKLGKSGVSSIASSANINRRNVYDSLERLLEKGIIFEVVQGRDTVYEAVEPSKLLDILHEKEQRLQRVLPEMTKLFKAEAISHQVILYEGIEGWKMYMKDILRTGQDLYTIGAKGQWVTGVMAEFGQKTLREAKKKGVTFHILFDASTLDNAKHAPMMHGKNSRVLPKEFNSSSAIDIYGDNVVISTGSDSHAIDESFSLTVIKNPLIAESFRVWWKALWKLSSPL